MWITSTDTGLFANVKNKQFQILKYNFWWFYSTKANMMKFLKLFFQKEQKFFHAGEVLLEISLESFSNFPEMWFNMVFCCFFFFMLLL